MPGLSTLLDNCMLIAFIVQARQRVFIRLWFAPHDAAECVDVYLFVNNKEEQTEECLLVRVKYCAQ